MGRLKVTSWKTISEKSDTGYPEENIDLGPKAGCSVLDRSTRAGTLILQQNRMMAEVQSFLIQ